MPYFSSSSKAVLEPCHDDLKRLFYEVVKHFDCKPTHSYRTPEYQFELYKKGRILKNGLWVIDDKNKIVTNCDGYKKLSKHNYNPSQAIDICPYPISWKDINRFYIFGGVVETTARYMGIDIRWGGDWDGDTQVNDQTFNDLPHFEIIL